MEQRHKTAINNNRVAFQQQLQFDEAFLAYFNQGRPTILNENMCDGIMSKGTRQAKIADFLTTIQRRGARAFDKLIEALVYTDQEHLANFLDETLTAQHENTRYSSHPDTVQNNPIPSTGQVKKPTSNDEGALMSFDSIGKVTKVEVDRLMIYSKIPVYPLKRIPRGRCIILNNDVFSSLGERKGSGFDVKNTVQLFKKLHFRTFTWLNLKAAEIKEKIENEAKCGEHANADAFIFVAMSHGNQNKNVGYIYGTDGKDGTGTVEIQKDIMDHFDGKKCPHLAGKPKVFIIAACQGERKTTGILSADGDEQMTEEMEKLSIKDDQDASKIQFLHEKADFLLVYATVPGYLSWRNTGTGTWFMQDFNRTVADLCPDHDIQRIMTKVTTMVEERTGPWGEKQICKLESTLKKLLYFFPGYSN